MRRPRSPAEPDPLEQPLAERRDGIAEHAIVGNDAEAWAEELVGYVERGEVRPVGARTYRLDEIAPPPV